MKHEVNPAHVAYDRNGHSYLCHCDNPGSHDPGGDADYDILDDSWQPETPQWEEE